MYLVQHPLWVREAFLLKVMASPLILLPVVPVLHNVVNRDMTLPELCQGARQFVGSLVAFTALPEAHHPLRIDGCLACQSAVTTDDLIHVLACNEVIIHVAAHLTPDAQLPLFLCCTRLSHTQTAITHAAIGLPLDAHRILLASLQGHSKLVRIGVPCCAPTLSHHFLAVDIDFNIACVIEDELVVARLGSLDGTLIHHLRTLQPEALGQVLNAPLVRLTDFRMVG